uniref:Putative ixodes 26 kDa salivary protein n=1 Tax=Ixodes ricinus TaxID=34613 RepID=A0A0K8R7H4_IXORI
MKIFFGVLICTYFSCCFAIQEKFEKYYLNNRSDEKSITIAFLLAGFPAEDANLNSEVGEWLDGASELAQKQLSKELSVKIKFDITHILTAPAVIWKYIIYRTTQGQMHGPSIITFIQEFYRNSLRPDILIVLTKYKFYDGPVSNALGFSNYKTLCEYMVPILLTYDWNTMDDVEEAGRLLSKLVRSSVDDYRFTSSKPRGAYFNGCNIRHKPKGYRDDDDYTYYVLPHDEVPYSRY